MRNGIRTSVAPISICEIECKMGIEQCDINFIRTSVASISICEIDCKMGIDQCDIKFIHSFLIDIQRCGMKTDITLPLPQKMDWPKNSHHFLR